MTPFEVKLRHELELEQHRFGNEWLFRWHNLNIEGKVVDVDRFDGGRITLGGITFGDQQQSIYWQAIRRYLTAKVHSILRTWDEETKSYPDSLRVASLDDTCRLLETFIAGVVKRGIETHQAVLGGGFPTKGVPHHVPVVRVAAITELRRLRDAHIVLMPAGVKKRRSWGDIWEAVNIRPGLFGVNIDLKKIFKRRK